MKYLHQTIVILLFIILSNSQTFDCTKVTKDYCGFGYCHDYVYQNDKCVPSTILSCPENSRVFNSSIECTSCTSLTSAQCSTKCSDFFFDSTCVSCQSKYGIGCISCDNAQCKSCVLGLSLNDNKNLCRNSQCTSNNCLACRNKNRCEACQIGFELNLASLECISASCNIKYCIKCNDKACSLCASNYKLSTDSLTCQPICHDPKCTKCIAPGVCAQCQSNYKINYAKNICIKDCSKNLVAKCYTCNNDKFCQICQPGYSLIYQGIKCAPNGCVKDCLRCSDANDTCLVCNPGFVPANSSKSCANALCIINNCNQCNDTTTCKVCADGFSLSQNNKICVPSCAENVPSCQICSNTDNKICQVCKAGFQLKITESCSSQTNATNATNCTGEKKTTYECISICSISKCTLCSSSTTCLLCENNYALNSMKTACLLDCNIKNCAVCEQANKCKQCGSNFELQRSGTLCVRSIEQGKVKVIVQGNQNIRQCKQLFSNCIDCSQSKCNTCATKYVVDLAGSSCIACDTIVANCLQCTNFQCLKCKFPFRLSQNLCVNCSLSNCATCSTNLTTCEVCENGFTLQNGICVFINNCPTGTIFYNGACVCPTGLYWNGQECINCYDTNCISCASNLCNSCVSGYYPSGNGCAKCIDNCQICSSGSGCDRCIHPYTLLDNTCKKLGGGATGCTVPDRPDQILRCPVGCSNCFINNNILTCIVPVDGYAIFGGVIQKCDESCKTCSAQDPSVCTSCFFRYTLVNGNCVKCSGSNARTCLSSNPAFSTSCLIGFTVVATPGVCTACAQNCARCFMNGPGKCDRGRCINGYVFNQNLRTCTSCFNNCPICSPNQLSVCISCGSGRYKTIVNNQTRCNPCPTECTQCSDAQTCSSCEDRYTLIGTTCRKNPDFPYLGYSQDGSKFTCFLGFTITQDNKCIFDTSCNANANCLSCQYGKFLSKGVCFTCNLGVGCKSCKSNTTANNCQLCNDGYFLNNGACSRCRDGCASCSNLQNCLTASDGFYIVLDAERKPSGMCIACQSPCATCFRQPTFCTSCIRGYSIEGSSCFSQKVCKVNVVFVPRFYVRQDSQQVKFQKLYFNMGSLRTSICSSLPPLFRRFRCHKVLKIRRCKFGSLEIDNQIDVNDAADSNSAASQIQNSFLQNGIDNQQVLKVSATTQGFNQVQKTNLGLILGVSIPLGIILILIIFLIIKTRNNQDNTPSQSWQNIDHIQSQQKAIQHL